MRKQKTSTKQTGKPVPKPEKKTVSDRNIGALQKGNGVTTVYIGNLRYTKDENDVMKMFSKFGKVSYVRLIMDQKSQNSKGFAFVQMPNKQCALNAIEFFNGREVNGRHLKASVAVDNNPTSKPKHTTPANVAKVEKNLVKVFSKRENKKGLKGLISFLKK